MRALAILAIAIIGFAAIGCGSGGGANADEAKLHKDLSGPPSLEGMAKRPMGARQAAGRPGAGGTATTGGAPAPTTTGQ